MSELHDTDDLIGLLSDTDITLLGFNPNRMTREEILDASLAMASIVVFEQRNEILGMRAFCVVCIIIAIGGIML